MLGAEAHAHARSLARSHLLLANANSDATRRSPGHGSPQCCCWSTQMPHCAGLGHGSPRCCCWSTQMPHAGLGHGSLRCCCRCRAMQGLPVAPAAARAAAHTQCWPQSYDQPELARALPPLFCEVRMIVPSYDFVAPQVPVRQAVQPATGPAESSMYRTAIHRHTVRLCVGEPWRPHARPHPNASTPR
ncbi:hypothetical protein PYCCODRAFT_910208 [Trametes coccinea BRFM310]|uniref:Uncharacterized protein n=1 Tax=Trametes coccinea (strain BRFM310) TaxID=1353009 RepID=A0A1Y2ICS6_TRAC3|nr:hypothetical protein PYCCODRAFT_910208 [Trametes coccinea BRFM310]